MWKEKGDGVKRGGEGGEQGLINAYQNSWFL